VSKRNGNGEIAVHPEPHGKGLVISDLHLFSRRSVALKQIGSLNGQLSFAKVLVLNGDIFDFRWSTLADHNASVAGAVDWLRKLSATLPDCQIHFVLGNHDCTPAFREGLTGLTSTVPRFQWHEYALRLGTKLLFHGDCANRRMKHRELVRFREVWERHPQRHDFWGQAYSHFDRTKILHFFNRRHFPHRHTVERVAFYLDDAHPGWRSETRDIYFGHTHVPLSNYLNEGIRFHNSGSAIRGMKFNPISF